MRAALLTVPVVLLAACATPAERPRAAPPRAVQAPLPEAFAAAEVLDVVELEALPADPSALPSKRFPVVPQRTVRLNDRDANAQLGTRSEITVRAASTATELAVYLEWADVSETLLDTGETNSFGDAVAVQLPQRFGEGVRLPYIGMGDSEQWVDVYMARATTAGVQENRYVAAGFGSLTRAPALKARMTLRHAGGRWHAAIVRPLADTQRTLEHGLVPIAFAIWDGTRAERGGNKSLSSWKFLRLPRYPVSAAYVAEVSWGYADGDAPGDPAKGKEQFGVLCLACHRSPDYPFAVEGMAPDLADVGAIALPAYLRQSIRQPSGVVMHHLNPNRAYDPSAGPDPNRAFPNNSALDWYAVLDPGQEISKMPELPDLSEEDVLHLVAYLRTLDGRARAATVTEGRSTR